MHTPLRGPLAAALMLLATSPALADVTRCTDKRGQVVYTDQRCPPGTIQTGAVPVPESAPPGARPDANVQRAPAERAELVAPPPREAVDATGRQAPPSPQQQGAGSGLNVIGPEPRAPREAHIWSPPNNARGVIEFGTEYPAAYPPGVYPPHRPPRPLPDQQPRMRQCDANGCTDTHGNHYNPRGQLDRYTGPGGKTCRPVGTTQIGR